jgi:MoxR-like ATPase
VTVDDDILSYLVDIVHSTRHDTRTEVGVSPRGSQRLLEAARSHAVIAGREYVRPVDIQTVGAPVLTHRLVMTTDATVDGTTADDIVADVFDSVAVPTVSTAAPETPAAGE